MTPWRAIGPWAGCAVVCAVAGGVSAAPAEVFLRGRVAGMSGEVVSATADGLRLRLGPDDVVLLGWDLVREVKGEGIPAVKLPGGGGGGAAAGLERVPGAGVFAGLADDAWRIRTRLERGDVRRAEELLEPLLVSLTGAGTASGTTLAGPTGTMLREAAVRTRLARGWTTGATLAWLQWLAARPSGEQTARWMGGSVGGLADGSRAPVIDAATGLSPWLPPVFSAAAVGRGLGPMLADPVWASLAGADGQAKTIAALYRVAAEHEQDLISGGAGLPPAALGGLVSGQAGPSTAPASTTVLARLTDMVAARCGDGPTRAAARARLESRLATMLRPPARSPDAPVEPGEGEAVSEAGGWQEAWLRLAIGRSLARESDVRQQRAAVIALLHLPARFGAELPGLSAVALAEAAALVEAMGDQAGAASLRQDLLVRFPEFAMRLERPVTPRLPPGGGGQGGGGGPGGSGGAPAGQPGEPAEPEPEPKPEPGG